MTIPRWFLTMYSLCILFMAPLIAIESRNNLRIMELIPNLLCYPLAVEPNIPADFIPLSYNGPVDPYDWIYWGPKEVLEAYFKEPTSLKVPLIRVKLSANVAQTGPDSFGDEVETIKRLKQENPDEFEFIKTQWGNHPVHVVKTKIQHKIIHMSWVGLNDPTGWTLMFNLVYPENQDRPNERDLELWNNLMMKTTGLNEPDFFKIHGQDLQEGYTLVNVNGAKLKMIAEKRQSDGTLQVVVIPESNVEFHYVKMEECLMGAKWKYGEPMVKVFGEIVLNNENLKYTENYVTSIFFKTVPEFSFKKDDDKKLLIFQN